MKLNPLRLNAVKKFYFLDYFYILLKSIEKHNDINKILETFQELKYKYRLGESKYKKLTHEKEENLTPLQINRYRYTLGEIIDEAKQYKLIKSIKNKNFSLSDDGLKLLRVYEKEGSVPFNREIFRLMEIRYNAFYYLINLLYKSNTHIPGLVIFPFYSPRKLHYDRSSIKTTKDIIDYSLALMNKLTGDIERWLGYNINLDQENDKILNKLREAKLLSKNKGDIFQQDKYNLIIKRFRDYWYSYFLRNLYKYEGSLSSFDIWTYRGKQIGIVYVTESYPNIDGRIVYPTSIILKDAKSSDFENIFSYDSFEFLYQHNPNLENNQDQFVQKLVNAYYDVRGKSRIYFVNLLAIREVVCYRMKISEKIFENFLNLVYKLNLEGQLRIKISLEVDKLPEETKAIYLKQEPVMVDGKYRNIIAIDLTKGK